MTSWYDKMKSIYRLNKWKNPLDICIERSMMNKYLTAYQRRASYEPYIDHQRRTYGDPLLFDNSDTWFLSTSKNWYENGHSESFKVFTQELISWNALEGLLDEDIYSKPKKKHARVLQSIIGNVITQQLMLCNEIIGVDCDCVGVIKDTVKLLYMKY